VNLETDSSVLSSMLAPAQKFPLSITPVSTHVNNARNKDQGCLEFLGDPVIVN